MGPLSLSQEDDSLAEPFLPAVSNLGDSNLDGPHEWLLQSLEPLLSVAFPPVLANLDASYLNASYLDASYLAANSFDFLQQEPAAKWKTGRRPVPSKFEKEIASRMLMSELPSVTYMKRKAVVDTLFSDTFREVSMAWSSVALHLKTLGMSKDYVCVFYPPPPLLLPSSLFFLFTIIYTIIDQEGKEIC